MSSGVVLLLQAAGNVLCPFVTSTHLDLLFGITPTMDKMLTVIIAYLCPEPQNQWQLCYCMFVVLNNYSGFVKKKKNIMQHRVF